MGDLYGRLQKKDREHHNYQDYICLNPQIRKYMLFSNVSKPLFKIMVMGNCYQLHICAPKIHMLKP